MKKLISVLLLLSLVFSLMTGVSISAFAAEDAAEVSEITADIEAILANVEEAVAEPEEAPVEEPEETPAEDVEETPAEDIEEIPVEDILESIVVEVEEAVAEISVEAPVLHGAAWTKAGNFVAGQRYLIGVENGDGTLSVLKNDGGAVVTATIGSAAEADDTMIWTANAGSEFGLVNNGTYLYYKNNMATTSNKDKWSFAEGTLSYQAGGDKYSITFAGGAFAAEKSAETPASLILFTDGADLAIPSKWKEASGFVDTQTYLIAVKNADDTLSVLKNDGGAVVTATIATTDDADESMIWTAAAGSAFGIVNNGTYLYYKNNMATTSNKDKWSFAEGTLSYQAGGDTYYITFADGAFAAKKGAETPATIVLYTDGSDLGSGESGDSGDSGGSGSGSSSVIYNETKDIAAFAYIGIVDDAAGQALNLDMGWHGETVTIAGEAPNRTMAATKGTGASVIPGAGGVAITLEDPPGEINYLYVDETGALSTIKTGEAADYAHWTYSGTSLCYTAGGVTYYVSDLIGKGVTTDPSAAQVIALYGGTEAPAGGGGGGGGTEVDAEAPVITKQPEAIPFVHEGSGYAAPTLTVAAQLAEGVTASELSFQWFVDGVAVGEAKKLAVNADNAPVENSITLNSLKNQPVGVYNIYCEITCDVVNTETGESAPHTTTSTNVAFTVCKGVLHNSFLTFSDVHETFADIGTAIKDTILVNNGLVPALIVCTGDWANGHYSGGDSTSENYATTMSQYISKLYAQVSGIDIVFLSGNHDNGAAAADATIQAALGATADYDGVGIMYNSKVETDGTSKNNDGLVVFGINYENLETADGVDYDAILPDLEAFLKDLEANYNGELVVISAHAGLHVLSDWSGGASYNVNNSHKVVALLNEYADTMDIMYFFGHDHSKGETEFFLKPGDSITSTINFSAQTTETQEIKFSYGHAGYIGSGAAGSTTRYSLVTWDTEVIDRSMSLVNGNEIAELTYEVSRVAEKPEIEVQVNITGADSGFMLVDEDFKPIDNVVHKNGDVITTTGTVIIQLMDAGDIDSYSGNVEVIVVNGTTYLKLLNATADDKIDVDVDFETPDDNKPGGETAPKTGDDANIVLWIAVLVLCAGSLAILPRKKHN